MIYGRAQRGASSALAFALAATVLLGPHTTAIAEETTIAAQALIDGRFDVACALAVQLPDTPDGWFVRGRCAAIQGRHVEAIGWFNRILMVVDAPRTRLELARSLALTGKRTDAARELQSVLRSNPPELIRESVVEELAALGLPWAAKRLEWRLGLGGLYDTNVNVGPRDRNVTIFGLPFQLSDASLGTAGHGLTSWLGVDSKKVTTWGDLQVSAQVDGTQYGGLKPLSYVILATQASLRKRLDRVEISGAIGQQSVRQRGNIGRNAVYASASAVIALTKDIAGSIAINAGTNTQQGEASFKSQPKSIDFSLRRTRLDGISLSGGIRMLHESFETDDRSHKDRSIYAVREAPFDNLCTGCFWSVSATLSQSVYQAEDPIFEVRRKDRLAQTTIAFARPAGGFTSGTTGVWRASLESSSNQSTLSVQQYRRTRLQLSREMHF